MIYVDPAHPAFTRLPRDHQARIYHKMGWDLPALAEEFGVTRYSIKLWVFPEFKEQEKARRAAYRKTERGKQAARDYDRRYSESGRRAEVRALALQETA